MEIITEEQLQVKKNAKMTVYKKIKEDVGTD